MVRALARLVVIVALSLAGASLAGASLAGCGQRSMLAPELDRDLTDVDRAVARGEVEAACAKAGTALPRLAEWAEGARGERAARGHQVVEQLAHAVELCTSGGDFAAAWHEPYQELRAITTFKTSWLTVFTYVSMIAVGIGTYLLLRRMRR
jgi:hypothetical protein